MGRERIKSDDDGAKAVAILTATGVSPHRAFEICGAMTQQERDAIVAAHGQADAGERIRKVLNEHADRLIAAKATDAITDAQGG